MLKMRVLCGGGPKVLLAQVAVLLLVAGCVRAWGGRFNRFNPTALNNYGYGGAGYSSNYGKEKYGVSEKEVSGAAARRRDEQWRGTACTVRPGLSRTSLVLWVFGY